MRLEVTRKAELAVQVIAALAPPGARLKGSDLAEKLGSTPGFVTQVVTPLVKSGWVASAPGPLGGYSLTEDGRLISVLDVIEAVDGPTSSGQCVARDRACAVASPCVLHEAWAQARHTLTTLLAATPATAVGRG